jgi:hypothetical protein
MGQIMPILDKALSYQLNELTLKSLDKSIVKWFEEDHPITVNDKKVPVIYATSERWARAQKQKGFRDEKGSLILPLVSIRRGEPVAQKERYAPQSDETNITYLVRISTDPISNARQAAIVDRANFHQDAEYLKQSDDVVYEILQVAFPSFTNLSYDVTIWTSYMTHSNIEQENVFIQFGGGRQVFSVDNYFFFGRLNSVNDQSNLDDFSDREKIIKHVYRLELFAYLISKDTMKRSRTISNIKINIHETSL